jgi:hypothetical protein
VKISSAIGVAAWTTKPADCRAISMKCNNCQRLGHFALVCHSKGVSRKLYESQKTLSKKIKAHRNVRAILHKDSDSNELCIESESERRTDSVHGRAR